MALVNGADLARRLGVSQPAIVQARRAGRIRFANGSKLFDEDQAAADFLGTSRRPATAAGVPVPAGAEPGAGGNGAERPMPWPERKSRAEALLREIELHAAEGRVLPRADVDAALAARDALV